MYFWFKIWWFYIKSITMFSTKSKYFIKRRRKNIFLNHSSTFQNKAIIKCIFSFQLNQYQQYNQFNNNTIYEGFSLLVKGALLQLKLINRIKKSHKKVRKNRQSISAPVQRSWGTPLTEWNRLLLIYLAKIEVIFWRQNVSRQRIAVLPDFTGHLRLLVDKILSGGFFIKGRSFSPLANRKPRIQDLMHMFYMKRICRYLKKGLIYVFWL